ncbi:hypothetical protein HanRHA438_Chr04g0192831 [Helianthus annuus]|nr:hypothetical protein HanIR_Chr04g0197011 [Helianthus annuus]KAJ0928326.1 hypothetical protein HanRHA438_Chr04g0192831 [Helianthus annuus]
MIRDTTRSATAGAGAGRRVVGTRASGEEQLRQTRSSPPRVDSEARARHVRCRLGIVVRLLCLRCS